MTTLLVHLCDGIDRGSLHLNHGNRFRIGTSDTVYEKNDALILKYSVAQMVTAL